ncbi:hypothetical protein WICPIJ_010165, partial [Wickerhamomyces pijperi]
MPKSKQAEEDIFDTPDIVMQDDDAEEEEEEEEEEELEELEQLENDINEQYKYGDNEDDEQDVDGDDDDNDDDNGDDNGDDDDDDEDDEYDEDNDDDNDDEEQEEEDDEEMVDALEEVSKPESDPKSTDSQTEDKVNRENDNKANSSKDPKEQTSELVTDGTSTVIPDSEASVEKAKVGSTEEKEAEQSSSKEEVKSQDVSVTGTDAAKQDTAIAKEIESSESIEKQSQDDPKTESSSMKETDPSTSSPATTTATATHTKDEESTSTSTSTSVEPEPVKELPPMEQMLNHVKTLRTHASLASQYNIIPQVAIPYASAIHSVAFSQSGRYLFMGGEDGFIRKYDTFQSIDGEAQLTAAQRHSVVDSVTNGGALLSYWENEIPFKKSTLGTGKKDHYDMKLSPVYSLAVQSQGMWLLSGLANGGVNLQSLRHQEGTIVHHWKQHTNIISDVLLNGDETKFITGGWDMKINQYDLNTGDVISRYEELPGQVIGLEYRPTGVTSVNIADIAPPKIKDDDLDSLFGDDDEEEEPPLKKLKGSRPTPEEPVNSTFEKDPNVFLCTGTN